MSFEKISTIRVRRLIANRELISATPDMSVREASQLMKDYNIGAVVVLQDEKLVGVLSERDVVRRCVSTEGCNPDIRKVGDIMTENPITIPPFMSISVAAMTMIEHNIRHLPVVKNNRVLGMISIRRVVEEFRRGANINLMDIAAE